MLTLTQGDKQKYLEYLQKRGLPIPMADKNIGEANSSDAFNLIKTLTDSILEQFSQFRPELVSTAEQKSELEFSLTKRILLDSLDTFIESEKEINPDIVNYLDKAANFEEVLAKITVYAEIFDNVAVELIAGILYSYLNLCQKYSLKISPDIAPLLAFVINQ